MLSEKTSKLAHWLERRSNFQLWLITSVPAILLGLIAVLLSQSLSQDTCFVDPIGALQCLTK